MNENVEKIFKILGVEPNEHFIIKECDGVYMLDEKLNLLEYNGNPSITFAQFLEKEIIKLPRVPQEIKRELLLEEMQSQENQCVLLTDGEIANFIFASNCNKEKLQGSVGTNEEMKFLKEKRQVEAEVRFMMKKYPDTKWDGINIHFLFYYNYECKELTIDRCFLCKNSEYSFPSKESLLRMLEFVGEERYIKYIVEAK